MNGIEATAGDRIEIVRLDLVGSVGRRAAREFGVQLVPATLLFDGNGRILYRHTGLLSEERILEATGRKMAHEDA